MIRNSLLWSHPRDYKLIACIFVEIDNKLNVVTFIFTVKLTLVSFNEYTYEVSVLGNCQTL